MTLDPRQITPRIYQGGWILTQDIPDLVRLGVTHILNLDQPYPEPLPFIKANITVHNVMILDACLMTPQRVREAIEIIDDSLSSPDHKIYIHCIEGVSRSPTITWLYLIHTGLSPDEAIAKIQPNPLLYNKIIVHKVLANRL